MLRRERRVFEFSLAKMYRDGDRLPDAGSPERERLDIEQAAWLGALRAVASPFPRQDYPGTGKGAGGGSTASHQGQHYGN